MGVDAAPLVAAPLLSSRGKPCGTPRWFLGYSCLALLVCAFVGQSEVAQYIQTQHYNKPFFLTWLNHGAMGMLLPVLAARARLTDGSSLRLRLEAVCQLPLHRIVLACCGLSLVYTLGDYIWCVLTTALLPSPLGKLRPDGPRAALARAALPRAPAPASMAIDPAVLLEKSPPFQPKRVMSLKRSLAPPQVRGAGPDQRGRGDRSVQLPARLRLRFFGLPSGRAHPVGQDGVCQHLAPGLGHHRRVRRCRPRAGCAAHAPRAAVGTSPTCAWGAFIFGRDSACLAGRSACAGGRARHRRRRFLRSV
jgi:hypothetical protein